MSSNHQSPLEKAQEKMRQMREAGWKPVQLNPIEKAKQKPNSLKLAIRAMCWTCEGADSDPGVKQRVGSCRATLCPLWSHRPWQHGVEHDTESESEEESNAG